MTDNIEEKTLTDAPQTEVSAEQVVATEVSEQEGAQDTEQTAAEKAVMKEKDIEKTEKRQKAMRITVNVFIYVFLTVMAVIVIFPFYWMIMSSFKSYEEYYAGFVPTFWPTQGFDVKNFLEAFEMGNLGTLFINTLYVGLVSTVLSLIITVLSAFAFARLEFKGKNILFAGLLATMMIPGELFTITNFKTVADLGWKNTYVVLILPFLVSVFYIYLLRQNFMQIPNELYYAAKVDGTSDLKYLWKVMIPLAMPTLITITILKMMGSWNSYVWPNLVNTSDVYYLVTVGIRKMDFSQAQPDIPVQMAAVTLVSIPLFLVFIFLRKYIMRGVSRSGIKG
ncbi:MAG: carbohydrate ABC transporter permease [Corallococcus sp.]|nr:carbohydrate ABC transporter permease [Bacillota bacterium]MCM1533731.1 carbohydrate ABC transporter permease [Corallococcus sp.]